MAKAQSEAAKAKAAQKEQEAAAKKAAKENQKAAAEELAQRQGASLSASDYEVTQNFTQHLADGKVEYKKGDPLPKDTHPNYVAKYLSAGFIKAVPKEEK